MKRWILPLALSLFLALGANAGFAQGAAATSTHAGFLKEVRGSVHLVSTSGQTRLARSGDSVAHSDRIETDVSAGASLVLRDGTVLVIGPSSRMDLRDFRFDATTQDGHLAISLLQGTLRMISGLLGKVHPKAVQVETQTATIGIRGTDFIVNADNASAPSAQ
ncbi:MAG: FecR domain-containing protein [Burkholderiaceae bacterium]|jgi:hypothetical protein|nr:FecR domain-containing protein [Burkholderiaceae bacterium]